VHFLASTKIITPQQFQNNHTIQNNHTVDGNPSNSLCSMVLFAASIGQQNSATHSWQFSTQLPPTTKPIVDKEESKHKTNEETKYLLRLKLVDDGDCGKNIRVCSNDNDKHDGGR